MIIEKIWPYLPTPITYAVIMLVALAALFSASHAIMAMVFLWVVALAFVSSTWLISRPFHVERLAVLLTLATAHASMFAVHLTDVYDVLHLHDAYSMMLARVAYSVLWLLLTGASLFSYARNSGYGVARIWPLIVILTLISALFPIEPDAFIVTQPAWLWVLRIHAAFALFMAITLGDAASVLAALYRDKTDKHRRGHHVSEPSQRDFDVSLVRTLLWSPISLWVMFVPRVLLFALLVLIPYLIYTLLRRWELASLAHRTFTQLIAHSMTSTPQNPAIDTVIDMVNQLNGEELTYVMMQTGVVVQHEELFDGGEVSDQHRHHHNRQKHHKPHHRKKHEQTPLSDDDDDDSSATAISPSNNTNNNNNNKKQTLSTKVVGSLQTRHRAHHGESIASMSQKVYAAMDGM